MKFIKVTVYVGSSAPYFKFINPELITDIGQEKPNSNEAVITFLNKRKIRVVENYFELVDRIEKETS